ncbi:hypothetical protein ABIB40_002453 [Pedobacter sp. UYP30]|uniref:hypothetical protein n=1 Tax=Pedobacter sp. UYP30 TaxID=1756400 RepID=UPI003392D384
MELLKGTEIVPAEKEISERQRDQRDKNKGLKIVPAEKTGCRRTEISEDRFENLCRNGIACKSIFSPHQIK